MKEHFFISNYNNVSIKLYLLGIEMAKNSDQVEAMKFRIGTGGAEYIKPHINNSYYKKRIYDFWDGKFGNQFPLKNENGLIYIEGKGQESEVKSSSDFSPMLFVYSFSGTPYNITDISFTTQENSAKDFSSRFKTENIFDNMCDFLYEKFKSQYILEKGLF